jgi:hypothetical protein
MVATLEPESGKPCMNALLEVDVTIHRRFIEIDQGNGL